MLIPTERQDWPREKYDAEIKRLRAEAEQFLKRGVAKTALADELAKETVRFSLQDLPLLGGKPWKIGSLVYFQDGSVRRTYTLKAFHEWQDTATIENGAGKMIVRRSELKDKFTTDREEELSKLAQERNEASIRLDKFILAYAAGLRGKELADKLGLTPRATAGLKRSAKYWGFITE